MPHVSSYWVSVIEELRKASVNGPNAGLSRLYQLAYEGPVSHDKLPDSDNLLRLMVIQDLREAPVAGSNAGLSVLYWLCKTPQGQRFLSRLWAANTSLVRAMTIIDLRVAAVGDPARSRSALLWLCMSPAGQFALLGIFTVNKHLRDAMTIDELQAMKCLSALTPGTGLHGFCSDQIDTKNRQSHSLPRCGR